MKNQAFNPFLPSWEYIPDGEPHVFGDRVYLYGSHDKFNGKTFCMNDYVCWSAPVDDLSDWRYEGVTFKKSDDPAYRGKGYMYAPDVCLAPDGRYYIYYAFTPGITRKSWRICCARADKPTGPFKYVGEVNLYPYTKEYLPFDPAVYTEGGRVWLYYGSAMFYPVLGVSKKKIKGGAVIELNPADMLTPIGEPKTTISTEGTHGFFEASSMRKIGGIYYFVYSSKLGHELCYATSDAPDGEFKFGGTLVSNGDIGLNGHTNPKNAANFTGNTHGGMLSLNGKNYIFYHRQTNRYCYSRQMCAEEVKIEAGGAIAQTEITSCGLNGQPLEGKGEYPARIACNLTSPTGGKFYAGLFKSPAGKRPYFTQSGVDRERDPDQYIANFCSGATAGFKYFKIEGLKRIGITVCGNMRGKVSVSSFFGGSSVCEIDVTPTRELKTFYGDYCGTEGTRALFFTFNGSGKCDKFVAITLQ